MKYLMQRSSKVVELCIKSPVTHTKVKVVTYSTVITASFHLSVSCRMLRQSCLSTRISIIPSSMDNLRVLPRPHKTIL